MKFKDRVAAFARHQRLAARYQKELDQHEFVVRRRQLITRHQQAARQLLTGCTHDRRVKQQQLVEESHFSPAVKIVWEQCVLCAAISKIKERRVKK